MRGGQVVTATGMYVADIVVSGGKIVAVTEPGLDLCTAEVVDASGRWVLPGVVDIHVHLRDPGYTTKEDFASGTAAAACGGVTTIADMPNTRPPTTTPDRYEQKRELAERKAHIDFALWAGGLDGSSYVHFRDLGAVGIKLYLAGPAQGEQYDDELAVRDDRMLYRALHAAAAVDLPVAVHLANPAIEDVWRQHWHGRGFADLATDVAAESRLDKIEAAQRVLLLAEHTGAHVHLVHVPAAVLDLVHAAKARGVQVTAESFLPFMSTTDIPTAGPLGFDRYRRPDEVEALWEAMRSGPVDTVATDHAPHTWEEKQRATDDLLSSPSGYPELETGLPMMLDAVSQGRLTPTRMVDLMCTRPARLAGLAPRKGAVVVGADADLVVVDPAREWTIRSDELRTKAGWTPFDGRKGRGRIDRVILRGETITLDGAVTANAGNGRYLARAADRPVAL